MPGGVTPAVFLFFPVDHILKWRVRQPGENSERRRSFLQVLGKADINLTGPCANVWVIYNIIFNFNFSQDKT